MEKQSSFYCEGRKGELEFGRGQEGKNERLLLDRSHGLINVLVIRTDLVGQVGLPRDERGESGLHVGNLVVPLDAAMVCRPAGSAKARRREKRRRTLQFDVLSDRVEDGLELVALRDDALRSKRHQVLHGSDLELLEGKPVV